METQSYVTMSTWYYWSFGIGMITTFVFWLIFGRLSMARIEKMMKNDGLPEQFIWDGVGARIFLYAYAIVFSEKMALRIERLIDATTVRSYANKADWWRGLLLISFSHIWVLIIFYGAIFGISDS